MNDLINGKTPEEIVEANRHCSRCFCDECAYFNAIECQTDLKRDCADLIKHLEATQPRWISVKERLPEEKESVLVHYVDGWMPIAFLLGGKWYQSGGETSWLSVTHWMPLPEPPEERG